MAVHLYVAPAAAGKTAFVLDSARLVAADLRSTPLVCVPSSLQLRACRRRLAQKDGAIGIRLLTFDQLYKACLDVAGETYTQLSEPVQYRLIRAVVDELPLVHYAPLKDRPGWIELLQRLIGEWKAAGVPIPRLQEGVRALGNEPRLAELVRIYECYQEWLHKRDWADRAGLGWLAVEALSERATGARLPWRCLFVDGFDNLTHLQLALLKVLSGRLEELHITLTGGPESDDRRPVYNRFNQTRAALEEAFGIKAEPLPTLDDRHHPVLQNLQRCFFQSSVPVPAEGVMEMVECANRMGEVREALRWLKRRIVEDELPTSEVALLARSIVPYRPFILQTAAEFGLPIRLVDGLPLDRNPAVAALLDLLRLMLPLSATDPQPALPRRPVIEAWRSPYFRWALPHNGTMLTITPADADLLDRLARASRVIAGLSQWEEMFARTVGAEQGTPPGDEDRYEEEGAAPVTITPAQRRALAERFAAMVRRIRPPAEGTYRQFVGWLEDLIGAEHRDDEPQPEAGDDSLRVVECTQQPGGPVEEDRAALHALKDVLRGLVWAEESLANARPVTFARFFQELEGAVKTMTFNLPSPADRDEVIVADVVKARGVPLAAVAIMGLAEGEFPAVLSEDPLLRNADRIYFRDRCGLPMELPTDGSEAEYCYEALTRARARLLLTRPRIAENGGLWQASPYWEEVCRCVQCRVVARTSESVPAPSEAASWPELLESLATRPPSAPADLQALQEQPDRVRATERASELFRLRFGALDGRLSPYEGDLTALADDLSRRFGPSHSWSASRLEAYAACPMFFFVQHVLGLEPRPEPVAGLDPSTLGSLYHLLLERLYAETPAADRADVERVLQRLPQIADQVFAEAPQLLGFRETAWWSETRRAMEQSLATALRALHEHIQGLNKDGAAFVPHDFEVRFWDEQEAVFRDGDDALRLHGIIDRIDRAPDGRAILIDYKTGGKGQFTNRAVDEGKKMQLALYARAAAQVLGIEPVDGFYWHLRNATASPFTLYGYAAEYGKEAQAVALDAAWRVVRAVRAGRFPPQPAENRCPPYCPAVAFCWRYTPPSGG